MNELKIMIVEDEPIVALDIERTLVALGYNVIDNVTNYEDTLSSIDKEVPDIIFMDISLCDSKNGIQLAKKIKQTKDISIIYLTAFSDDDTMEQAIATNPVSYILKPFKREELKSSILLAVYKIKNANYTFTDEKYTHMGHHYYYDRINSNLFYKDQPIQLSKNENKLLHLLVKANG